MPMTQDPGWLETLAGRRLLSEEVRELRRVLDGVFGDQLVQIGTWGGAGRFRRLARTRRTAVFAPLALQGVDVVSMTDSLAIVSESVDAVLLPHTLDLVEDPHALLREVGRILRADGQLVILGFNPWSWWGCRHLLSGRRFPPGSRRMISRRRLHDWLRLLDFQMQHSVFYHLFLPALLRRRTRPRRPPVSMEQTGRHGGRRTPREPLLRRVPVFAGCYVLVARKQTFLVTPIRMTWRRSAPVVGRLVNPTMRSDT